MAEIISLLDFEQKNDIDLSVMLNYERVRNGAPRKWLMKKD